MDSEITALTQAGPAASCVVGRRLRVALIAADRATRVTSGAFDPRIAGRLEAWGTGGVALGLTATDDGLGAPERVVEAGRHGTIRVPYPVDLGGIGKGLALRWASDRLGQLGIDRFLLDAGRDLVVRGLAPDAVPWRIGIEDPGGGDQPVAVVELGAGAIATSSLRRGRWRDERGILRHHLIDPRTGAPADGGLLAVTVAASDPAWAEVWSKALFVGGGREIAARARARGLAAWWIADDGTIEMTAAARQRTIWVAGEA
jgi:thiamine biosynthesis lipoprotein